MKDYYGWRAKIGLIYPAEGLVMEPEFCAMAPEGVSIHTARVDLTETTVDGLSNMMDDDRIEVAAPALHLCAESVTTERSLPGWRRP